MKKKLAYYFIMLFLFCHLQAKASEGEEHKDHAHDEDQHEHHDDHGKKEVHNEEDFQISPQAEKNFEIKRIKVVDLKAQSVPKAAIVTTGTEVNLYRYRKARYKRIDFETLRKSGSTLIIKSKDLAIGDEIVIQGMGLLRIAEIAAFGGAPEGHSH